MSYYEAFNGNLDTNPFFFQHFNLSKMDVTCDGHSVYGKPFEPRFGNDQYLRSFLSVYQALASQNQVQNCNIDYEDYKGGYCYCQDNQRACVCRVLQPDRNQRT